MFYVLQNAISLLYSLVEDGRVCLISRAPVICKVHGKKAALPRDASRTGLSPGLARAVVTESSFTFLCLSYVTTNTVIMQSTPEDSHWGEELLERKRASGTSGGDREHGCLLQAGASWPGGPAWRTAQNISKPLDLLRISKTYFCKRSLISHAAKPANPHHAIHPKSISRGHSFPAETPDPCTTRSWRHTPWVVQRQSKPRPKAKGQVVWPVNGIRRQRLAKNRPGACTEFKCCLSTKGLFVKLHGNL